jgi:SAM-dependent methyltransferase
MTPGTYVPDQQWHQERERLAAMEDLWDPGTKAVIDGLGVAPGWRCIEVGAGAGSIAAWLADRVAPGGEVLATDLSLAHIGTLRRPNLHVRVHDILTDPLPEGRFDLVHARLVVEHLGRSALNRMVPPLRSDGWLVIEAHDWAGAATYPEDQPVTRVVDAMLDLLSRSGFDRMYGRKLVRELELAGFEQVAASGRLHVYRGGSPGAEFLRLSLESLRGALLESGGVTEQDLETALARIDDAGTVFLTAPMIAAWGRKPAHARVRQGYDHSSAG